MPGNRGTWRMNGPLQPGMFPWAKTIHGAGPLAQRPLACAAMLGMRYLATDVPSGTEYHCLLQSGYPAWLQIGRPILSAAPTIYVATTGSDSNNGLSASSPFLTVQHASNVLASYDGNGTVGTIKLADGTYAESVTPPSLVGYASAVITGNSVTPSNVKVSGFILSGVVGQWAINNLQLNTSSQSSVYADLGSLVSLSNVVFPTNTGNVHVNAGPGGTITLNAPYTISGGAGYHLNCNAGGKIVLNGTTNSVTVSGTPAFSVAFAVVNGNGCIQAAFVGGTNTIYNGAATGQRHIVQNLGLVINANAYANYFPGNSAGTPAPSTLSSSGGYFT